MRLAKVRVRDFKSVRDCNSFEVGPITCLVGKNEAGKTALLEALYRLNPIGGGSAQFDVTDDYPRAIVKEYEEAVDEGTRSHAVVIEATFTLESHELGALAEQFREGVLRVPSVTLTRGYENKTQFHLEVDELAAIRGLLDKAEVPEEIAKDALVECSNVKELLGFFNRKSQQQAKAEAEAEAAANDLQDSQVKARALDEAKSLAESEAAKQLRTRLAEIDKSGLSNWIWENVLGSSFPKFLYFDEYYQMEGHLNIEKLQQRQQNEELLESDLPMLALMELARLEANELLNLQRTEALLNKLEGAGNFLNRQLLKYWSQSEHLFVTFALHPGRAKDPEGMQDGTNLLGRVFDSVHSVTTPLGRRSKGFIWFFSFLAYFSQQKRKKEPMILLLDEPGLHLHASAQADLLRFIEAELSSHQVIYTTHSPFMVDPRHFERVRIIEDKSTTSSEPLPPEQEGTKVFVEVLEASESTLFPLQGALGYDIVQTLFIGPNSLIIEGVSDLLYIQTISALLEGLGKTGLSKDWTLTPVGGSDKISTFVALLGSQKGLRIATLIDLQKKHRQKIEGLYKSKLLSKKRLLTFADFTGAVEADIEDMFGADFYLELVSKEFAKELDAPITEGILPTGGPRLLPRVEEYLEARGITFNHYRPARYFAENASSLKSLIPADAFSRFQTAFEKLNGML